MPLEKKYLVMSDYFSVFADLTVKIEGGRKSKERALDF